MPKKDPKVCSTCGQRLPVGEKDLDAMIRKAELIDTKFEELAELIADYDGDNSNIEEEYNDLYITIGAIQSDIGDVLHSLYNVKDTQFKKQ